MSRHVDVLVVGLGPTGSTLAALLARGGLRVAVFDRLFDGLTKLGMSFPSRRVEILVTKEREVLADRLAARLEKALPHVEIARDALDQDYYDGVRLKSGAAAKSGDFVPIGDHGVFDWVGKLASDRRRRYVASGFGLQLAPALFG